MYAQLHAQTVFPTRHPSYPNPNPTDILVPYPNPVQTEVSLPRQTLTQRKCIHLYPNPNETEIPLPKPKPNWNTLPKPWPNWNTQTLTQRKCTSTQILDKLKYAYPNPNPTEISNPNLNATEITPTPKP